MDLTHMITLAGLALVDSTSFGTLMVPVLLLLARRPQLRVLWTYLATIAVFYWAVGVVLMLGGAQIGGWLDALGDAAPDGGRVLLWGQAVVGALLLIGSFFIDGPAAKRRRERRAASGVPSRRERWTSRLMSGELDTRAVMVVAILAGLAEVATMLPYLGAVALITGARLPVLASIGVLGAYVLVMIAPAVVLAVLRMVLGRRAEPLLDRLHAWLRKASDGIVGWIVGILGFLILRDAVVKLFGVTMLG